MEYIIKHTKKRKHKYLSHELNYTERPYVFNSKRGVTMTLDEYIKRKPNQINELQDLVVLDLKGNSIGYDVLNKYKNHI